jgi:PAS domain S-box-containing protein
MKGSIQKEKISHGQNRYKVVAETNDGIWEYDVITRNSYWNDQLYSFLGYNRDATNNQSYEFLLSIIHPEDAQRVEEAFLRCVMDGFPYDVEYRIKHNNGYYVHIQSKAKPIYNNRGEIIKVAGSVINITQPKQEEEVLLKSDSLFSGLFNQTSVGIVQANLNGKFTLVNDRFCNIVGRSKEDLYKISLYDIIYHDDLFDSINLLKRLIHDGIPFILEKRYRKGDGSIVWVNTNVSKVNDLEGNPLYLLAICQDITERKQAEEALQESEERFRAMAEASGILIAQGDKNAKAIYFNHEWERFTGRSLEELYKYGWEDFFHPDDKEAAIEAFQAVFTKKEILNREFRLWNHKKGYRWLLVIASPRYESNGTFSGYVSSCIDITDRKLAEEALVEKEFQYRTLIEEATVATALYTGIEHKIQYANEMMLGYWNKDNTVIGKSLLEVFPEPQGYHFFTILDDVYKNGSPYFGNEEKFQITIDGILKTYFFNYTVKPLRDQKGQIYGIHNMGIDVTDQVMAQNSLKESEERFRIMADASPLLVWALNPDASLRYVNKFTLDFLGIDSEKFKSTYWSNYIHPDDLEDTKNLILNGIQDRQILKIEHRFRRFDGEFRWLLTQGAPSYYPNGELYGYVGSSIDITDRKQAEKSLEIKNSQLTRTNNDLDNFIYTASHDLKAPIINIEGLVNALNSSFTQNCNKNDEVDMVIGMIQQSVDRFKETIKDLTEVAKVQNSGEEDLSEMSFHDMLEEVKLNIKILIDESNAVIQSEFTRAPVIYFSKKNLRSIIYNLVSNAIKYKSSERPIVVKIATSKPDPEHVLLTVQDNGLGIKDSDKWKVFTMFKRLHQHVEGTGIGLSIVKKIIDNNGGTIDIESEIGKGTTFKVYIKV